VLAAVAADAVFLRSVIASGDRWGIWDWDYQCSLLEAARKSIVEYGQWPFWNPWLGGGHSLAGHPLGRTFNPSFVPVLVFGTLPGVKVDVVLYMMIGQLGAAHLLRRLGSGWIGGWRCPRRDGIDSAARYQMRARTSGARYILSPGRTPKAS